MKHIIVLAACCFLFTQCRRTDFEVHPTGTVDTLGVTWMTIERDNIIYYFQGNGINGASIYTDLKEEAYVKLNGIFHAKLPKKLRYFVWTDWDQATRTLGHPLSFALPRVSECHVRASVSLGHEITHVLAYWANGIPEVTHSRFVTEGVAVAFDLEDYDRLKQAKNVLKDYHIESITDFWGGNMQEAPEEYFYPVAGAFMEFLYKQNETEKYMTLLKHQTIEEAEYIYGKERLHALIAEFDKKLGL